MPVLNSLFSAPSFLQMTPSDPSFIAPMHKVLWNIRNIPCFMIHAWDAEMTLGCGSCPQESTIHPRLAGGDYSAHK